jgi:pimeloyl-ACP methyl ester carboxylesterase
MTSFVLLHGAFHGGWCWARVAPILRAQGHAVFTPTQTGLGERAHLLSRQITLDTFVQDLLGVLESEELEDAVLVGHSFGGIAITGAADRVPRRIRSLVYLDSAIPRDGCSSLDLSTPEIAAERRRLGTASGGLSVAPPDPAVFGVPPGPDSDWVRRRLTPHPFGAFDSTLTLANAPGNGLPCTYVFCTDPVYESLARHRDYARAQPGWLWRELAAGHDAMVTHPAATAALLMELAP